LASNLIIDKKSTVWVINLSVWISKYDNGKSNKVS